ncbi:citron Rho-interacting kinase-like [Mizuhopecten yessoensis]|uniref:citron Rho-interacting kinase-like n=1 Tax=Mizuhopecten yessoensis TaxID=6573 RepID=UPI000B45D721|nr:citron Rho-interacting kinase-like [Mizuhopecten yessoensis]
MEMSLDSICHRIRVLDDLVQGNVETSEIHTSLVTKEGLLDALITLYDECGHEFVKQNKHVAAFVKKYGKTICEIKKIRIRATDFEVKDAIGRGHFGEVLVVREKSTDIVYAMKILRKNETLAQQEISFYEEERDIMAKATSPWITRLHYAFQDSLNLHLVMDFHAGGDLLTLLSRHDDIFEESMARFYLAEMTLSIDALHNMGYVHRDVKPENILLDCQGHVKLADFGSAAKLSSDGLVSSQMPVGTPDYVSPELLITMNNDQRKSNSGVEVDWWSLGICLYEMLFGKTPFTDEGGSMVVTYSNIMNFKKCLKFPENHHVSSSGVSLIRSLLAEKDDRLSFRDITKHKFFCSINWDDIRQETPPFVPHLSCLDDTSNFEELERVRYQPTFEDFQKPQEFTGKDLPFVGFTYIRKQNQDGQPKNIKCCSGSDSSSETDFSSTETEYLAPARAPHSPGHTDLQVTLTVKVAELQTLKEDCHKLEETECRLKAEVERLKFKGQEKDDELCRLNIENEGLQVDLQRYVERSEDWKEQLEVALHERDQLELKAENLLVDVKDMQTEADQIETEIHRSEMEEIQDMVVELEQDKCNLRTKLKSREKQLALCREQIESQQDQISKLQRKLDKEQRKSLDGMKRDVSSMEKRNEAWRHKIEGKNMEVMTLNIKLQEMEELLEVYQLQEKDFMEREQELLRRVDGGGLIDKMELRVWLKSCPMQESKDSENRKRRIEELEQHVTMLDNQAEEWREKEDGFQETIDQLQREMDTLLQELKTSEKSKHSLAHQVRFYQEEAKQLKQRLQDLSENVKQVSQDEDEKTKHTSLVEKRVKDLEADVELLRTERRHLLADVIKFQEEADNKTFKVAELERVHTHVTQTISRMTSRLERLERQLTDSRDREVEVRLRAKEHADFRLKVANEKIKGLEEEKASLGKKQDDIKSEMDSLKLQVCRLEGGKSEASSLKDECDRKSSELIETKNQLSKSKEEKFDLSQKVRRLTDDKDNLERSVSKLEERVEKLNKRLKEAESQAREVIVLRSEKEGLERRNEHLQKETSKLNELTTVQKERDALTVKLQSVEKELEEQKLLATKRWNKIADAEDIRQTNNYLESKVKDQQEKVEQLEIKVKSLEGDLKASKERENRIQSLMEEVDRLRLEKKSLEVKMRELQVEWESKQRETTGNKREVHVMEEKFSKEKEKHDQVIVELRRELHDANLALSEARSLLAASERQERNNKERYESEIRDLQLKLHRSENIIDLEQELKLLKSQAEKSTRQYKEMEDRISSLQKEKSSINMEKHMIQDQLVQKEHECELETQKVSKLQTVCSELEEQLQELEALTEEHDRQQSEWNNIRETFETAVVEREEEIEGTSHRLHALEQAKQTASEKVANIKKQMTSTKASHKAEIEALNHRIWEIQRAGLKNEAKVSELKEHNMQLKCVADSQKRNLEADLDEKRALKEEISTVMTECQDLRTKNLKLKHHLDEAMDKFELIFGEKMDLEGFTDALQGVHFLEKYKFESTIGQQMKLIDYLHALWAENSATKKKKSGSKLFGSAKTKDVLSPGNPMPYLDLQTALDQERKRCNKLQEQNEKLRQEKFAQANEWCEENTIPGASEKNQSVLKLMGSLKENDTLTPSDRVAVAALVRSPSAHSASVNLLTPSVKRSSSVYSYSLPQTASQRMHHNIPHRFITGLNTRATKCAVCLGSVPFVKQASKCQEYHMVCHPKCVSAAPATCGLPTEYVQHFQEIMSLDENTPVNRKLSLCKDDKPIHMQGFLKIPSTGTQGWERKWASLEDNILMLYNNETDANPIDSFNLNPQETDVTVHSAISTAELPNTAQTDLNHVIKVEHEPLTTCWPGRVLYLMAMNFSEKSKWVASFEGAVKNLQKKDSVKRQKLQTTVIMELMGEKRLDINCTKVFSKQMLLLGADEGLYAVSMQIGKPTTKVKLAGFKSVHQIEIISAVGMVIMVIGKNRRVVWVDKKLIKIKLDQATGNESPPVHYDEVEGMFCCTLLEVKRYHDTVYMCVGMVDRVIILKYNTDLRAFCVRKELMTSAPCSCMCITNDFVIVGTDKFYRIDLEHPAMTEFVDKKDNSLAFAAFGAAIHKSFPIDVVKVSPEGLPLEYLLCFHEFGVFVDIKGRRSRPKDLKWSCLPLAFGYSEPFLYIIYFNSVQGITIPADKDDTRGKQTILDMHCPRYLGRAIRIGGVYVSISDGQGTQLVCLRGNDGMNINYYEDNKENKYSLAVNKGKGRFGSPRRGNTMGSSHMRRQLSGSSLDSNFSEVSSVSTATSVESCTTYGSEI